MFFGSIVIHVFLMPLIMIDNVSDFRLSPTQFYGAVCMACSMVTLEAFMHPLPLEGWLITCALFFCALYCLRFQIGITDTEYLHDMIPHHSMALLTSKAILKKTHNHSVFSLAKKIEMTQAEEIAAMKRLAAY